MEYFAGSAGVSGVGPVRIDMTRCPNALSAGPFPRCIICPTALLTSGTGSLATGASRSVSLSCGPIMPIASAAAIRNTTSSLLKVFRSAGKYVRLADEPNVCKSSFKISTASFLSLSQFASLAGFFLQPLTYFFTTSCFVMVAAFVGGLALSSRIGPPLDSEVALERLGTSTAATTTKVNVNCIFMGFPPEPSMGKLIKEPQEPVQALFRFLLPLFFHRDTSQGRLIAWIERAKRQPLV